MRWASQAIPSNNGSHRGSQSPGPPPTPRSGASEPGAAVPVRCCHPYPTRLAGQAAAGLVLTLPATPRCGEGEPPPLLQRKAQGQSPVQACSTSGTRTRGYWTAQSRPWWSLQGCATQVGGGAPAGEFTDSLSHWIWATPPHAHGASPRFLPLRAPGSDFLVYIRCSWARPRLGCSVCLSSPQGFWSLVTRPGRRAHPRELWPWSRGHAPLCALRVPQEPLRLLLVFPSFLLFLNWYETDSHQLRGGEVETRPGSRRKWGGVSPGTEPAGVGTRTTGPEGLHLEAGTQAPLPPARGPHSSFSGSTPPQINQGNLRSKPAGSGASAWGGVGRQNLHSHHLSSKTPPLESACPPSPPNPAPPTLTDHLVLEPGVMGPNLPFGGFPLHTLSRKKVLTQGVI